MSPLTDREIRLLDMAARQGLLLRRPNARDSVAGRYGLIPADLETPALARARLAEFFMSIDEVEIRLSGAGDFDLDLEVAASDRS